MGFSFRPEFEGDLAVDQVPEDFFERIRRRVEQGLLPATSRTRVDYHVIAQSRDSIEFEARGFLTAYAIGLNHVELRRADPRTISYHVRFDRWNRYAVFHGALIGLALAIAFQIPATHRDIQKFPVGQWMPWGMLLFWSFIWPWLMTALHRPFARRALERVLTEELAKDPGARAAS